MSPFDVSRLASTPQEAQRLALESLLKAGQLLPKAGAVPSLLTLAECGAAMTLGLMIVEHYRLGHHFRAELNGKTYCVDIAQGEYVDVDVRCEHCQGGFHLKAQRIGEAPDTSAASRPISA